MKDVTDNEYQDEDTQPVSDPGAITTRGKSVPGVKGVPVPDERPSTQEQDEEGTAEQDY